MIQTRLPLLAWLLMMIAAVALLAAQLHGPGPVLIADANVATIVAPVLGTPTMLVVLIATLTPAPTNTPWPPTATPAPTETPWPHCPQSSGGCEWPWPSPTMAPPRTETPYPICSTPVLGQRCFVPTPSGGID